ncbi:MAG: hypothetical protein PVI23_16955, partial [Maricaulaceae bacterium]
EFLESVVNAESAKEHFLKTTGAEPTTDAYDPSAGVVPIPDEFDRLVRSYFEKLTLALHYRHQSSPAPKSSSLLVHWFTNQTIVDGGLPREFNRMFPESVELRRGAETVEGQFDYRWGHNETEELFGCIIAFGDAFGAICATKRGSLPTTDLPWRSLQQRLSDRADTEKAT